MTGMPSRRESAAHSTWLSGSPPMTRTMTTCHTTGMRCADFDPNLSSLVPCSFDLTAGSCWLCGFGFQVRSTRDTRDYQHTDPRARHEEVRCLLSSRFARPHKPSDATFSFDDSATIASLMRRLDMTRETTV